MSSKRLVVFAPGLGFSPAAAALCKPMARKFRHEGYDTKIFSYDFSGMGPIQRHSEKVLEELTPYMDQYDHITGIGHSMGGLVIRMLRPALDAAVTIATPHRGYRRLWEPLVGWSPAGDQMKQGSTFFESLEDDDDNFSIIASRDVVVDPDFQKWGTDCEWVNAGHLTVMTEEQTFWEIWSWLTFNDDPDDNLLFFEGQGREL